MQQHSGHQVLQWSPDKKHSEIERYSSVLISICTLNYYLQVDLHISSIPQQQENSCTRQENK